MPVRNGLLLYELRRSNCLPESIATGPALLGPLRSQRCLADARREPPSAVLILFYSGEKKPVFADRFLKMVGERGLRAPAGRALRAVAFATLSRCARRNPPSEVLIHFYSGEKKPVFADRFLKMVGERGFEPPTHWSQTSCATKLRYSPIFLTVLPGAKRGT